MISHRSAKPWQLIAGCKVGAQFKKEHPHPVPFHGRFALTGAWIGRLGRLHHSFCRQWLSPSQGDPTFPGTFLQSLLLLCVGKEKPHVPLQLCNRNNLL